MSPIIQMEATRLIGLVMHRKFFFKEYTNGDSSEHTLTVDISDALSERDKVVCFVNDTYY